MPKLRNLLIAFIVWGCAHPETGIKIYYPADDIPDIYISPPSGIITISEIVDSIGFIILDSKEGGIIGNIGKVVHNNHRFHLHDEIQEKIFVFSEDGEYISRISRKGPGPEEYPAITDFSVKGDTIVIFNRNKLYMYDINGNFLINKLIPFVAYRMELSGNHYYFFRHGNTAFGDDDYFYDLIISDQKGEITNKFFPYTEDYTFSTLTIPTPFFRSEDNLFFISPTKNSVFLLDDGEPVEHIRFAGPDPGRYTLSYFFETTYATKIGFYGGMTGSAIISRVNGSVISYNSCKSDEKFLFKGQYPKTVVNDKIISVLNPHEFGWVINSDPVMIENIYNYYPQYKDLLDYIRTENVNPIITVEKYKQKYE